MKVVFSAIAALLLLPATASAQQIWTKDALVKDMFPTSDHVEDVEQVLTSDQQASVRQQLGYAPADHYGWVVASTGGHVDGYVLFDHQIGKNDPIDFAVELDPSGVVLRTEVVVYREQYGGEVADARFRRQFVGKKPGDPIVAGKDVKIVSGATYSSRAMAVGVKRAVVLGQLLISQAGS